jgi:hypothetical protein
MLKIISTTGGEVKKEWGLSLRATLRRSFGEMVAGG